MRRLARNSRRLCICWPQCGLSTGPLTSRCSTECLLSVAAVTRQILADRPQPVWRSPWPVWPQRKGNSRSAHDYRFTPTNLSFIGQLRDRNEGAPAGGSRAGAARRSAPLMRSREKDAELEGAGGNCIRPTSPSGGEDGPALGGGERGGDQRSMSRSVRARCIGAGCGIERWRSRRTTSR